jgi:hypothetical protein
MRFILLVAGVFSSLAFADGVTPDPALEVQGQAILAQIQAATSDETELDAAYAAYSAWQPLAQASPTLVPLLTQMGSAWGQAIAAAAGRDSALCAAHDLNQIARLRGLSKWAEGHSLVLLYPGVDVADLTERTLACATFQLELESAIVVTSKDGPITISVKASAPLTSALGVDSVELSGSSSIDYVSQSWPSSGGCTIDASGTPGELQVGKLEIPLEMTLAFRETIAGSIDIGLAIPKEPTENLTATCPSGTGHSESTTWAGSWGALRIFSGQAAANAAANFAGLALASADVAATQAFDQSIQGKITESGELRLVHTPR